jgi:hypothetical protein
MLPTVSVLVCGGIEYVQLIVNTVRNLKENIENEL